MAKVEGRIAKNPPADGPDDLTFDEVLEQALPLHDDDPFKVATWLNSSIQKKEGIRLLADGIPVLPHRCATELRIVAKVAGDARATLEVVALGRELDLYGAIDTMGNRLIGALARKATVKAWTIERESFEANRPDAPRNLGGAQRTVDRERLLTEALIYTVAHGWPDQLKGEGGLFEKLAATIRNMPTDSTLYDIFSPIVNRIKAERGEPGKKPKKPAR